MGQRIIASESPVLGAGTVAVALFAASIILSGYQTAGTTAKAETEAAATPAVGLTPDTATPTEAAREETASLPASDEVADLKTRWTGTWSGAWCAGGNCASSVTVSDIQGGQARTEYTWGVAAVVPHRELGSTTTHGSSVTP